MPSIAAQPEGATGALALADGSSLPGPGDRRERSTAVGEVCFNTSMTGYQEILTDPSYAGQIITFTFPHIGNVGTNDEDIETTTPRGRGVILRGQHHRPLQLARGQASRCLAEVRKPGRLAGVDTRRLTRLIRDGGAPDRCHLPRAGQDPILDALGRSQAAWPASKGWTWPKR